MATKDEVATFSLTIENMVWEKDISYTDAIVLYCQKTGLEVELAAKLITGNLKAKIKHEAEELHILPKSNTNRLPL